MREWLVRRQQPRQFWTHETGPRRVARVRLLAAKCQICLNVREEKACKLWMGCRLWCIELCEQGFSDEFIGLDYGEFVAVFKDLIRNTK